MSEAKEEGEKKVVLPLADQTKVDAKRRKAARSVIEAVTHLYQAAEAAAKNAATAAAAAPVQEMLKAGRTVEQLWKSAQLPLNEASAATKAKQKDEIERAFVPFGADLRDTDFCDLRAPPDTLHQVINFLTSVQRETFRVEEMFPSKVEIVQIVAKARSDYNTMMRDGCRTKQTSFQQLDFVTLAKYIENSSIISPVPVAIGFLRWFIRELPQPLFSQKSLKLLRDAVQNPNVNPLPNFHAALLAEPSIIRHTVGHIIQLIRLLQRRQYGSHNFEMWSLSVFIKELGPNFHCNDIQTVQTFVLFACIHTDSVYHLNNAADWYHLCSDCQYTRVFGRSLGMTEFVEETTVPAALRQMVKFVCDQPSISVPLFFPEVRQDLVDELVMAYHINYVVDLPDFLQQMENIEHPVRLAVAGIKELLESLPIPLLPQFLMRDDKDEDWTGAMVMHCTHRICEHSYDTLHCILKMLQHLRNSCSGGHQPFKVTMGLAAAVVQSSDAHVVRRTAEFMEQLLKVDYPYP